MKIAYNKLFLAIFIVLFKFSLFSQQDLVIVPVRNIAQSHYTAPCLMPNLKLHLSVPPFSSFYSSFGHTGFHLHEVFIRSGDSIRLDVDKLINLLPEVSYLSLHTMYEPFSFGLKINKNNYFSLSIANKMYLHLSYPKNLIEFLDRATGDDWSHFYLKFENTLADYIIYNEYALGYTHSFKEKLNVGARLKYLQGLANAWAKKGEATLDVQPNNKYLFVSANVDVYAGMPNKFWQKQKPSISDYLRNYNNSGLGLDIGCSYKFWDKLTVGANAVDLGFISWNSGTRRFRSIDPEGSFTFKGADFENFFLKDDSISVSQKLQNFRDTLAKILQVDTLYETYTYYLNPQINFLTIYDLTEHDRFAAVFRSHFYLQSIHHNLSISYTRRFGRIVSLTLAYNISNKQYNLLGTALALNLFGGQIFVSTDNIPFGFTNLKFGENQRLNNLTIPRNTKIMNVHFGISISVQEKKKPKIDI